MKYILNGHNSFYIRENWLIKIYTKLFQNGEKKEIPGNLFSKSGIHEAIDTLGIGSAMAEAVKYWGEVFKIFEKMENNSYSLTELGKQIYEEDKYFQNKNSLWLLHYNVFKRKNEKILVWEEALKNNFFSKSELEEKIAVILKEAEVKSSEKSIRDGVSVFLKSYLKERDIVDNPEENIISPFVRLNYLKKEGENYRFREITSEEISDYLILYILLNENLKDELNITEAYGIINNIIKMTKLEFNRILNKLEYRKDISIDRAGGLENIILYRDKYSERTLINKILERELI